MSDQPLDQSALVDQLGKGADERTRQLARDLVADRAREADPMPNPSAVLRYQREALEETLRSVGGDQRDALELELLKRQAAQLSSEAFSRGRAVSNETVPSGESVAQGRNLLERCEKLADALNRFGSNALAGSIRRNIEEAMLDALYVVERKAMSPRLARELSQPEAGPPNVR